MSKKLKNNPQISKLSFFCHAKYQRWLKSDGGWGRRRNVHLFNQHRYGDFIHALDTTNSGVIYYPRALLQSATAKVKPAPILMDPLLERELELVQCIIQGMKNTEIADSLLVSAETVKSHVSTAIHKLGVRDRTQAAVFALTHGLVKAHI